MKSARTELRLSPLGEIVVALDTPLGSWLYWTTQGLEGRLDESTRSGLISLPEPGAATTLRSCYQIHGVRSVRQHGGAETWCEENGCDGLWTDEKGIALAIKVADCLPVTMIASDGNCVANVHAGWRGAAAGIVTETVKALPSASGDLEVWLGPAIRACCFEVGHEVIEAFEARLGDVSEFVVERGSGSSNPHLDLAGIVAMELERLGVDRASIRDTGLCTRCDHSIFHSYRRSGPNSGRNLAVTGLRND